MDEEYFSYQAQNWLDGYKQRNRGVLMRGMSLFVAASALLILLSGCSAQGVASNAFATSNASRTSNNATANSSERVKENPWPTVDWVLTDELMKQKHWLTEYNAELSINHWLSGDKYSYTDWHLPPKWVPYLYKNQHWVKKQGYPMELNDKTLFITLQGTVFLKWGTAGRDWPPLSAADIPPDAVLVAEFVPLKKAVKNGIIPVYQSQPFPDGSPPAPLLKILGMTQSQYDAV